MHPSIVARSYAETLLTLAQRNGGLATADQYLVALEDVAALLASEPRVRAFILTPRISADAKKEALRAAFGGRVPELFLRFLLVVVDKRRQSLIPQIAVAFRETVDRLMGRTRVDVTLAHVPDAAEQEAIRAALERKLGISVVPRFAVDPELIGGIVVRLGDQVMDGSLRRGVQELRRRMLRSTLPEPAAAGV